MQSPQPIQNNKKPPQPIRSSNRQYHSQKAVRRKSSGVAQTKPKPRKRVEEGPYYKIRDILDERIQNGVEGYVIDWEDGPNGEKYPPSWEPKSSANEAAVQAWEHKKQARREEQYSPTEAQTTSTISSQESEAVRPPKRKRGPSKLIPNGHNTSSPTPRFVKRSKVTPTEVEHDKSNTPSDRSLEHKEEIQDSLEDRNGVSSATPIGILVEVPVDQSFDQDAYVPITSSALQSTADLVLDKSSPYSSKAGSSQVSLDISRPVGRLVVPDSQDLGSTSQYNSSNLASTQSEHSTHQLTAAENSIADPVNRQDILASFSREASPSETRSSAGLSQETSSRPLTDRKVIESHSILSIKGILNASSPITSPTKSALSTYPTASWGLPFTQPVSSETLEAEEYQFQTQVPHLSDNSIIDDEDLDHLIVKSPVSSENDHGRYRVEVPSPGVFKIRAKLNGASQQNADAAKSNRAVTPHAEGICQISNNSEDPSPQLSKLDKFEIFEEGLVGKSQSRRHSEGISQDSAQSVLSQRDANLQRPSSQHADVVPPFDNAVDSQKHSSDIRENLIPTIETSEATEEDSSSLPVRPSTPSSGLPQISDTYHLNQLQRPRVPSTIMSGEQHVERSRPLSVAEMLIGASSVASERETRSPSIIPQKRPSSPSTVPNQLLPVREPVAVITSSDDPIPDPAPASDQDAPTAASRSNLHYLAGPMEFLVPLPIVSFVRDAYQKALYDRRREIEDFLLVGDKTSSSIAQMDSIIEFLKLLGDHQDLTVENFSQASLTDEIQSKWAESCSAKFLFLRELLDVLRSSDIQIAILARPGKLLDIIEALLMVNKYVYERLDTSGQSNPSAFGPLKLILLPTGRHEFAHSVHRVDAVIAFDNSFHGSEQYSEVLRTNIYEPMRSSPLISLVVANSPEHFELCLPKSLNTIERKIQLINLITRTRQEVGVLDPEMPHVDQATAIVEAAASVAQYLNGNRMSATAPEWPLHQDPYDPGSEDLGQLLVVQQSGSTTQSQNYPNAAAEPSFQSQGTTKRTFGDLVEEESSKRMRMTPVPGDSTPSEDMTRVSESIAYPSQRRPTTMEEVTREVIEEVNVIDDQQSGQVTTLLAKVTALEIQVQSKDEDQIKLREKVRDLETKLTEYSSLVNKFQAMYQMALKQRAKAEAEKEVAKTEAAAATQRMEARLGDVAKLKEEKAKLQEDLNAAHASLANSSVPEAAALAKAQDETRSLQATKEQLERKISSIQRDFEFTRGEYQKASSSAVELSNELLEAKEEITKLQRKADENTVRIAEIQRSHGAREREERIEELEAQVREYQQELFKKNEELKAKTNGRRDTRGTSIPRSPRMGSGALSPRPYASRAGNGGSRGNSPAPGEQTRDPQFRDPIIFPQRWNHLRENNY